MVKNELMTVAEAARRKGVSRQAIHAAIESGRLATVQVGSIVVRITPEALAALEINPNKQVTGRKSTNGHRRVRKERG